MAIHSVAVSVASNWIANTAPAQAVQIVAPRGGVIIRVLEVMLQATVGANQWAHMHSVSDATGDMGVPSIVVPFQPEETVTITDGAPSQASNAMLVTQWARRPPESMSGVTPVVKLIRRTPFSNAASTRSGVLWTFPRGFAVRPGTGIMIWNDVAGEMTANIVVDI